MNKMAAIKDRTWRQALKDIETVTELYLRDEEKHWRENDRPKKHVYLALRRLARLRESVCPGCLHSKTLCVCRRVDDDG